MVLTIYEDDQNQYHSPRYVTNARSKRQTTFVEKLKSANSSPSIEHLPAEDLDLDQEQHTVRQKIVGLLQKTEL